MSGFDKRLTVHTPLRATVLSAATAAVTLPLGTEYFDVRQTSGAGTLQWSAVSAAEAANAATAWAAPSGNVVASPTTLYIHAASGDVVYEIFLVREGR
jgi:hypothetical protein